MLTLIYKSFSENVIIGYIASRTSEQSPKLTHCAIQRLVVSGGGQNVLNTGEYIEPGGYLIILALCCESISVFRNSLNYTGDASLLVKQSIYESTVILYTGKIGHKINVLYDTAWLMFHFSSC